MTKRIAAFKGETPKISERLLDESGAQVAVNCVLERGVITPIRLPRVEKSYNTTVGSMFKHKGEWFTWPQEGVKVAAGPVADDRLYITGDGVPKLYVDGTTYPLALPAPEEDHVLTGEIVTDDEFIYIQGTRIVLKDGNVAYLPSGLRCDVSVEDRKATLELRLAGGVSAAVMVAVVNSIRYLNESADVTEGTRVVTLTEIKDSGDDEDEEANVTTLHEKSTIYLETENYDGGADPSDDDDGENPFGFKEDYETLVVDGTAIYPKNGAAGVTAGHGYSYSVTNTAGTAELVIKLPNVTPALVGLLVNSLKYANSGEWPSSGVRSITVSRLVDSGSSNNTAYVAMPSNVYVETDGGGVETEVGHADPSDNTTAPPSTGGSTGSTIGDVISAINDVTNPSSSSYAYLDAPEIKSTALNPRFSKGDGPVSLFKNTVALTLDSELSRAQTFTEIRIQLTNWGNDYKNDPPLLLTTALNPSYTAGDGQVAVFKDTKITTVDADAEGQTITGLTFTIDNLANGAIDPATAVTIQWAYTWVTQFDEESPPSDMSTMSQMDWNSDLRVKLTGFLVPPTGRGINRQRIYRSQTSTLGETKLYFIYERVASGEDFVYDPEDDAMGLGETCPSLDYDPPEDGLQGIACMANGIMVGFVGKNLYFGEPYIPHAWPADYMLSFEHEIVGLATFGQYVAVLTTGMPYIVGGLQPDSMSVTRTEMNAPCLSAKSIVDFAAGCLYASTQGLVMVGPGGVQLASQGYFTRDQWQAMAPGAMVGGLFNGKYLGTYTIERDGAFHTGMFIMDIAGSEPYITRYSDTCNLMFNEVGTGTLYMLKDERRIYEWHSASKPYAEMVWRSKRFVDTQHLNYGAILIEGEDTISEPQRLLNKARIAANQALINDGKTGGAIGDLSIRLVPLGGSLLVPVNDQPPMFWCKVYADGVLIGTIDRMNVPVRLKSGFLAKQWEVEVGGSVRIDTISLGINPETLAQFAEG